jgi:hypothetical protein
MKKLECRFYLVMAWVFMLEPWESVGVHNVAWWRNRLKILKLKNH